MHQLDHYLFDVSPNVVPLPNNQNQWLPPLYTWLKVYNPGELFQLRHTNLHQRIILIYASHELGTLAYEQIRIVGQIIIVIGTE